MYTSAYISIGKNEVPEARRLADALYTSGEYKIVAHSNCFPDMVSLADFVSCYGNLFSDISEADAFFLIPAKNGKIYEHQMCECAIALEYDVPTFIVPEGDLNRLTSIVKGEDRRLLFFKPGKGTK